MNKDKLHTYIEQNETNICQIAIYKKDKLVYQDEFNGYQEDDAAHVMSVTKTIVSLLIGIAIDKGYIKSVDQKVLEFFPDYKVKRGEKTIYDVSIKHLLTMRAPYKGKGDPWTKVCISDNWTYTSLDFLGGKNGLTNEFKYATVCLHILSGILYEATKMKTIDFANEYLFKPLGIHEHRNFYARNAQEHKDFTLNKKPIDHIWFTDPTGLGTPGYGLAFSALDLAKIGLLFLHKGRYQNKQIVSSSWIKEMLVPRDIEEGYFKNLAYGYLIWIIDKNKGVYGAIGHSGNILYINQQKQLVISIVSYFKPSVNDRIVFIQDYLERELLKLKKDNKMGSYTIESSADIDS